MSTPKNGSVAPTPISARFSVREIGNRSDGSYSALLVATLPSKDCSGKLVDGASVIAKSLAFSLKIIGKRDSYFHPSSGNRVWIGILGTFSFPFLVPAGQPACAHNPRRDCGSGIG